MKLKCLIFCGLCGLCLFSVLALAAENATVIENPPVIIEEEDDTDLSTDTDGPGSPGTADYWQRHFSGLLFATYSGVLNEDNTRASTQARLRYDEDWSWGKVAMEGRAYRSAVKFSLESENLNTRERNTFSRTVTADNVELLEGYVDLDANYALFSLGRKRVVFGQFDLFSPVDLVLPIDFSGTTLSYSKVDNRLPQYVASAQFFIPGGLEVHYYYFPQLLSDQLLGEFSGNVEYTNEHNEDQTARFAAPKDSSQQAVRVLYVGSRLIAGLTYYEGYGFPISQSELLRRDGGYVCRGGAVSATIEGCTANVNTDERLPVAEPEPTFSPLKAYGFELSVPIKRYSLKLEWVRIFSLDDYNVLERESGGRSFFPGTSQFYSQTLDYLNWVANENDGKAYLERIQDIYSVGFDYYSDKLIVNFNYFCGVSFFDEKNYRGYELYAAATEEDNNNFILDCAPALHIGGNVGEQLRHRVGWALGGVGFARGTSLYYQYRSNFGLTASVSLDALEYINDTELADEAIGQEEDANTEVERTTFSLSNLRFALAYRF